MCKELIFLKSEPKKNVILTYQLQQTQIDLLRNTLQSLKFPSVIASAKDLNSIFTVSHFIAFFNFDSLDEAQEQAFFTELHKKAQKSLSEQLGKRKVPLIYILNCKTISDKRPHLFVNRDIFADKEKLRLALLQEIKAMEGTKPSEPVSERLKRILRMYRNVMYNSCLIHDSNLSKRRFYQDVAIIKILVPDITYDKNQGKYIAKYLPDKEEVRAAMLASNIPIRLKRVLLIYQQLLYEGWITKEVADSICNPVSLRMFQRDLAVIDAFAEHIDYDMDQRKYILTARRGQERYPVRIRCRNEYRRV